MSRLVIVGKQGCTHCVMAKNLCDAQGFGYVYKTIHEDVSVQQLEEIAGGPVRSVPQIYLDDDGLYTYIGGFTDLSEYVQMTRADNYQDSSDIQIL